MKCRAFFLVLLTSLLPLPAHAIVGGKASTAANDAVVLVLTHIPAKDTAFADLVTKAFAPAGLDGSDPDRALCARQRCTREAIALTA
jgi:hypothetical protein